MLEAGITAKSPAVPTNKLKPSLPAGSCVCAPPLPLYISYVAPPPVSAADTVSCVSLSTDTTVTIVVP